MGKWMATVLAGAVAAFMAAMPTEAQTLWKSYVVKDLGFAFQAPGEVKTRLGTFRGAIAGPRQTMIFESVHNNIEYKITVMSFQQAQAEGATILGERAFMFQEKKNVLMDTWARVEPAREAVYGRKIVVEQPEGKGRTFGAFYFTKGRLVALEATVLPANGDYESPDPARFIDSIAFNTARTGQSATEIAAPKLE